MELCEWQKIDEETGLVMPWFSHACLDWIKKQDWKDKVVLMYGAGLGDAWLAARCKELYVVERNQEWLNKSKENSVNNGVNVNYIFRSCNDSDGKADYYLDMGDIKPDVIINDDAYRTECCEMAVAYFKNREGVFICDNWQQDFVWISPKAEEIMEPFESRKTTFYQPDHTNHEGRQWNTTVWEFLGELHNPDKLFNPITDDPDKPYAKY